MSLDNEIRVGVAKGCLAGLALSVAIFLVGALIFFIVRVGGVSQRIALLIGIVAGPVVTSAVVLSAFVVRAQRAVTQPGHLTEDDTITGH